MTGSFDGLMRWLEAESRSLGFAAWGVADADCLVEEHACLQQWLRSGRHGRLGWMERRSDILLDPRHPDFLVGARSILMFALPCCREGADPARLVGRIARYARGLDYHEAVGWRLRQVLDKLERAIPGLHGRVFVDTAPIMEKVWGRRAGLGWIGRHGLLVVPPLGTYCVLGGIAIDSRLPPSGGARTESCGDCHLCVEACPVGALDGSGFVDARLCLSARTVERRAPVDTELARSLEGRFAFGCDTCQEICPHNAQVGSDIAPVAFDLRPLEVFEGLSIERVLDLPHAQVQAIIAGTAIEHAGARVFLDSLSASLARSRHLTT